jgi:hypothetical protein
MADLAALLGYTLSRCAQHKDVQCVKDEHWKARLILDWSQAIYTRLGRRFGGLLACSLLACLSFTRLGFVVPLLNRSLVAGPIFVSLQGPISDASN